MIDRRKFLRQMATLAATSPFLNAQSMSDSLGPLLPTRAMGRTGQQITAFTLGGSHMEKAASDAMSQKVIESALELGCRSFDTARGYGDGNSEILYGKFLTPKYRDQVYIATKTHMRTQAGAREELEISLRNMNLDYIDLWQMHSIRSEEDAVNILENGLIDEFMKARQEGLVRHIGFTGHRSYKAHLRLLELMEERGLHMDSCLMPMNLVDPHYDSFIVNVLPKLLEADYGVFAMKTFCHGNLVGRDRFGADVPRDDRREVPTDSGITTKDMHHYIYSLPVCSLVSGCLFDTEVRENIANLANFEGMSAKTRDALIAKASPYQGSAYEYYKMANKA